MDEEQLEALGFQEPEADATMGFHEDIGQWEWDMEDAG